MRFIRHGISTHHFSYLFSGCPIGYLILLPTEVVFLKPITILLPAEVELCSLSDKRQPENIRSSMYVYLSDEPHYAASSKKY